MGASWLLDNVFNIDGLISLALFKKKNTSKAKVTRSGQRREREKRHFNEVFFPGDLLLCQVISQLA